MFVRKTTIESFTEEYGVRCLRLYPWNEVVTPPFGSMLTRVPPGGKTSKHNHHEGETFFIVSGSGRVSINGEVVSVEAGDVIYAPPFSDHTTENTDPERELVSLAVWWEDMELARKRAEVRVGPARLWVTATPPTVNGNLHLGHLSGPYLAAEVFVRAQRLMGREVFYTSGADDHQSYVPRKAAQLGVTPREAAQRYTGEIQRSLELAGIRLDLFALPSKSASHQRLVQDVFRRLYDAGDIVLRAAPSLHCDTCDKYLFEALVGGRCPHCDAGSDGCACEACGLPNDCTDLREPRCKGCGQAPSQRTVERFFLRLNRYEKELREYLGTVSMPAHLKAIAERMLEMGLPDVAVSHVTNWGIPVPVDGHARQCVYVWFEMAAGYLAAAQDLLESRGAGGWRDVWSSDDSEVVQFFGIDNGWFHAVLFPIVWRAYDAGIHPPSAFVVNEFYRLDGQKFSTSRGHAVWVSEFLETESADGARFYLTLDRPEYEQTSFRLDDYHRVVQSELVGEWQTWLRGLGASIAREYGGRAPGTGAYSPEQRSFLELIHSLIERVDASYRIPTFSSVEAVRALMELVRLARAFDRSQGFLRGVKARGDERRTAVALQLMAANALATAVAPVMPDFSARLRVALGFDATGAVAWTTEPCFVPAGQDVSRMQEVRVLGDAPALSTLR